MRTKRHAIRAAATISLLLALGGCVIVPYGPYYHPHHYRYW